MKIKKIISVTLIASLTLTACNNQVGSSSSPVNKIDSQILNPKLNTDLTKVDYRTDIIELNDIAVFNESGGSRMYYLDSSKGLQLLDGEKIPPEILKDNQKFLEFMKTNKERFKSVASDYPLPDNSFAMHYDKDHQSLHWLAFNKEKTKWQEYSVDISNGAQKISMLQESAIDPQINKDNLAIRFSNSEIEGETLIDINYAEADIATDPDGQPIEGLGKITYLARSEINALRTSSSLKMTDQQAKLISVTGILANNYVFGDYTTRDEINFIKKKYPTAKINETLSHKEGFLDYLRNLSPILGLIVVSSGIGYAWGYFKKSSTIRDLRDLSKEQHLLDNVVAQVKNKQSPADLNKLMLKQEVETNLIKEEPKISFDSKSKQVKNLGQKTVEIINDTVLEKKFDQPTNFFNKAENLEINLIIENDSHKIEINGIKHFITKEQYDSLYNKVFLNLKEIKEIVGEIKFEKVVIDPVRIGELKVSNSKNFNELNNQDIDFNAKKAKKIVAEKYKSATEQEVMAEIAQEKVVTIIPDNTISITIPEKSQGIKSLQQIVDKMNEILKNIDPKFKIKEIHEIQKNIEYDFTLEDNHKLNKEHYEQIMKPFKEFLLRQIKHDFAYTKSIKKYPITAATLSAAAGTISYLYWKDDFAKLGSWIWGGCSKYVCNSVFLYGDKSTESAIVMKADVAIGMKADVAIGMKADVLYQQVPFNDGKSNYVLNVAQVFSQSCKQLIQTTSESQTKTLYAGNNDVNVGKHYLISDVNNRLCSIGEMDMNLFIESLGVVK